MFCLLEKVFLCQNLIFTDANDTLFIYDDILEDFKVRNYKFSYLVFSFINIVDDDKSSR
jgi:hypothetical protein